MRLGIDVRMIDWSGIGRYTENLISGLKEFGEGVEPVLFCDPVNAHKIPENLDFERYDLSTKVFALASPIRLNRELASYSFDVFHTPHFVSPLGSTSYPVVITIHDLTPLIITKSMPSWVQRRYYYMLNLLAAKKASMIIVPSESTKKDITRIFGTAEHKIKVIHEGTHGIFGKVSEERIAHTKEKFGIRSDYIFALGNQKPNKGLEYLIDAYNELINRKHLRHELIFTGLRSDKFKGVTDRIAKYGLEQKARFIGRTTDDELIDLYNGASVFVFPSLYEGFGLPPLEAMACETPVVASNRSSVPEVAGNAALIIDPTSTGKLAEAILAVIDDNKLRDDLVEKGLRRIQDFSLEKFTQETISVYEQVLIER